MYEELIQHLRDLARAYKITGNAGTNEYKYSLEAADAIEQLAKQAKYWELEAAALQTEKEHFVTENRLLVESWMCAIRGRMEWISVKDRLPKINVHHTSDVVLCYCQRDGAYAFSDLVENCFGQTYFSCERPRPDSDEWSLQVSHWLPLPEAPKESES